MPPDTITLAQQSGLAPAVIERLRSIFAGVPQVDAAWLYGSRAKGNYRPGSDIDLCLQGPALTFVMLLNLETALDDLLLPYKIDLSLRDHIDNDALRGHIARHGVPLYRRAG